MKIKKIILYQFNRAFRIKFHSSQTLRTKAESIVVQLEFENGILGYGESTPTTYTTGESCSSVAQIIQDCFSPILFNHRINKIDDVERVLNELENECLKREIFQYNSALGGIDIALLDALGKLQELPMTDLLGPIIRENIPYSISIPFLSQKSIQEGFLQIQKFEFKFIKVLLGASERENIERVSLVRSLFGEYVDIRVDVNERWKFQQAISNLEKLQKFHITAVEQPLAKDNIAGLVALRKEINIPIIVDESMCSLDDAKTLIEREACDILNIKISKCGGLLRSRRIAHFAQSQNIQCQLGAHVGETEILGATGKYFAFTTQNLAYFEGCSFLLFENSWRNNQVETESKREPEISDFGLGLESTTLQSIQNYCEPIVELVGEGG